MGLLVGELNTKTYLWMLFFDFELLRLLLEEISFAFQGQYEDNETGLYYNRFRYYDTSIGNYISQAPIGLAGGRKLYRYTKDVNILVDLFGLDPKEAIIYNKNEVEVAKGKSGTLDNIEDWRLRNTTNRANIEVTNFDASIEQCEMCKNSPFKTPFGHKVGEIILYY